MAASESKGAYANCLLYDRVLYPCILLRTVTVEENDVGWGGGGGLVEEQKEGGAL